MTSPALVMILSMGAMVFLASPAPAEATRPTVRPPVTIKHVRLTMPMSLKEVSTRNLSGLDLEEEKIQKQALSQASEYIQLRQGLLAESRVQSWLKSCQATTLPSRNDHSKSVAATNPFCRYEIDRRDRIDNRAVSQPRLESDRRSSRTQAANYLKDLKEGRFDTLGKVDYQQLVLAIASMGDAKAVLPIAQNAAQNRTCLPTSVTTAFGYKLEELFPDPEIIDLVRRLYQKSVDCGADAPAAKAAFRLGLLHVWQNQCAEVNKLMLLTESVQEASQYHSRAKYWRAHCAKTNGETQKNASASDSLMRDFPLSFQNLALNGTDEKRMSTLLRQNNPQVALRSLIRPDLNPVLRGAEALSRAGSPHLAAEMIDTTALELAGLEPEVRLYAAVFLNRIGFALPKFKVLSRLFADAPRMLSLETLRLMFPLWYIDLVKSKQTEVDPLLILALIRQESAFNKDARSIVGARGLMQVMPATARSIASVRTSRLSQPEINVEVGTKYFLRRLNQYSGDVELTLAAYNAGFARVDQWRKRYPTDNKILFMDFIPFRETREYVSAILRNYYFYTRLYSEALADSSVSSAYASSAHASSAKTSAASSAASSATGATSSASSGDAGKVKWEKREVSRLKAIMSGNAGSVARMSRDLPLEKADSRQVN